MGQNKSPVFVLHHVGVLFLLWGQDEDATTRIPGVVVATVVIVFPAIADFRFGYPEWPGCCLPSANILR